MNCGEYPGASHGKQRHRLGEAVDGVAPLLAQEQKDGGDQRASVADTDPPDEVDDGESPADGDGDAPYANALEEKIAKGVEQHHGRQEGDAKADEPAVGGRARQNDGAYFFGDRAEGVSRLDDRSAFEFGRRFVLLVHAFVKHSGET